MLSTIFGVAVSKKLEQDETVGVKFAIIIRNISQCCLSLESRRISK